MAGPQVEPKPLETRTVSQSTQLASAGTTSYTAQPQQPAYHLLSTADQDRYTKIFSAQAKGHWQRADVLMAQLDDEILVGYILADRYLAPGYKTHYAELKNWMAAYADHPQADRIFKLATIKGKKGFGAIKRPVAGYLKGTAIDTTDDGANWERLAFQPYTANAQIRDFKNRFRAALRDDQRTRARSMLAQAPKAGLSHQDIDELKLAMAADHFAAGRDDQAEEVLMPALARSGTNLPATHWLAGLINWRKGDIEAARPHFEAVAEADGSPWMVSAGAFWAARANLITRRPHMVNHWLEVSATYPRTFYGLLARRMLGYETLFSWESRKLTGDDIDLLAKADGTKRALALLQLGKKDLAEEELRKIYPRASKPLRSAMLALAQDQDMSELALRMGGIAKHDKSDASAYPIPEWSPRDGWRLDQALVLAYVRQESAFDPNARSGVGASGLMQLMPRTAQMVAGFRLTANDLTEPEFNLSLGQRYLSQLLGESHIQGNLLKLAAAYNAGPNKLRQWQQVMKDNDDPLLFIETLPSRETRVFVERVMTNYWIYASRLGQEAPSLDEMAEGRWPSYQGNALSQAQGL